MGPTPPVMQPLAVTDNELPQEQSYASALKDSMKLYEKGKQFHIATMDQLMLATCQ